MTIDHEAIKAEAAAMLAAQTNPLPHAVSMAVIDAEGVIHATGRCGSDEVAPEGMQMVEGEFELNTQRLDTSAPVARSLNAQTTGVLPAGTYPVLEQTEMSLTYPATVVADGVTEAVISGIPPNATFHIVGEENVDPVDDGVVTLTFDTPGVYDCRFQCLGWLNTTVFIEALSSP